MAFMSLASEVHVSDAYSRIDRTTNCSLNRKMFSIPDVIEHRRKLVKISGGGSRREDQRRWKG